MNILKLFNNKDKELVKALIELKEDLAEISFKNYHTGSFLEDEIYKAIDKVDDLIRKYK